MSTQSRNSTLAADLIWGVSGEHGIAREINRSESETYYLIASGALGDAVKKLGHRTIVASRTKLRRHLMGESNNT